MKLVTCSLGCSLLVAVAACSESDAVLPAAGPPVESESIDAFVDGLGHMEVPDAVERTEIDCNGECPTEGQEANGYCSYRRYTETEQLDRFVAFQPNSATLWPGVVVRGADAEDGLLTPVAVPLAPVTFSVSLENISGSPVGKMPAPSLSAFREERNRILSSDLTGSTPAAIDFEIVEVYSSSQLSLALDASVKWPGGQEVAASFDFDKTNRSSKIVVNFTQAYYTVDVDTPVRPTDFFRDDVRVDDLAAYVGKGNPPLYVQSITYGRRVIFTVESSASSTSLEAALSATFGGLTKGSVDVAVEHKKTIEESTIRAFVFGGSSADATSVIDGIEGIEAYIRRGGDYSKDSPGAPIAYKLAYLDNAVTRMALTSEYTERDCLQNRARLRAELVQIDHVGGGDSGSTLEIYGHVSLRAPHENNGVVSCDEGGEIVALWSLASGQWVGIPDLGTWTPTNPIELAVESVAIGAHEKLCLSTHIMEHDPIFEDDDFGSEARLIDFDAGWQDTHVLQPRGTGNNGVDVHVRVTLEE